MNEKVKRYLTGGAIFVLTLVPFDATFSQQQNQLIKPCTAEPPVKKEDSTNPKKKKGRSRPKTKDGKKDRNDQQQSKNAKCN